MEVELPKIDIVVSEWMGFRLLSEVMLDYLLYARDKDLKPGGLIFTDKTSLFIAGIENVESIETTYTGLRFGTAKPAAISEGFLKTPDSSAVMATPACVLDIHLQILRASGPIPKCIPFLWYNLDTNAVNSTNGTKEPNGIKTISGCVLYNVETIE